MRRALVGVLLTTLVLGTAAVVWQQVGGARVDVPWPSRVSTAAVGRCGAESDARLTAVCRGVWVRAARRDFVPQGLVLGPGRVAFVSGYHAARRGRRYCQVMVVDRRSGRTLERHDQIEWVEPGRDPVPCRHAGGLAASREGLWLSQSDRLWLLDRDALLTGADPVLRVWRLEAPVRGSVLVAGGERSGSPAGREAGRCALTGSGWTACRPPA